MNHKIPVKRYTSKQNYASARLIINGQKKKNMFTFSVFFCFKLAFCLIHTAWMTGCHQDQAGGYPITPVSPADIDLEDTFWQSRLEIFDKTTLPHVLNQCIETGRIANFAIASGKISGEQNGIYPFDDSDVFKLIEGMSIWLSCHQDTDLGNILDTLIETIASAQEPDGYLYTARRNNPDWLDRRSGSERWSNLAWSHELYNAGHLFLAAAAHYHATGKRTLLDVAYRNADLLTRVFGPGGLDSPPGHQVIEMGLVELYRISDKRIYLDLAKFFLDRRGRHENRPSWGTYAQDHEPVLEQPEAVGHAVRAAYMYAGMLDVSAFAEDKRYAQASIRLWENVVGKKIYLTGGLGSVGFGERFSGDFDLPNLSSYQETCASIANAIWNQKLFLYTGDGKYVDVLERTLYNALLAGISQTGDRFFYPNPLASRGYHERHAWFPCACCPTNVSRFVPTIPGLFYAYRNDTIFVNLFASSRVRIPINGDTVRLVQRTDYPWKGEIRFRLEIPEPADFELRVRIPGWARNEVIPSNLYRFKDVSDAPVTVRVNGQQSELLIDDGYIHLNRVWQNEDSITVNLPLMPRFVLAHPSVASDSARQAIQYGPFVYCLESVDQELQYVMPLSFSDKSVLTGKYRDDLFKGINVVTSQGVLSRYLPGEIITESAELLGIPYFLWANRGLAEMAVWIPNDVKLTEPLNRPPLAATANISSSGGYRLSAVNDGEIDPLLQNGFLWTDTAAAVWIQYDFPREEEFSEARVFWLTSGQNTELQPPGRWRIFARVDEEWHSVYNYGQPWNTETGKFNQVIFETVRTGSLRLEVMPLPGKQCGILEWEVN